MSQITIATFYKFVQLPDFTDLQAPLLTFCRAQRIKGTILLAQEGINGTIAGTKAAILSVIDYLHQDSRLADLDYRESQAEAQPFDRMKVRLKQEIVTLGLPDVNPAEQVGTYVSAQEWNQLIRDPEVIVIDTRNHYEVAIGSFQGAQNPGTSSFRQFPDYVQQHLHPDQHRKIAMFCTGGIRCEKASAYLLSQGFDQVYHLKGGILKYLEEIPAAESLWQGECFVFDQRVALQHGLYPGTHEMCSACGYPLAPEDRIAPEYQQGQSCPYCYSHTLTSDCSSHG